jgi:hypothetical protein
MADDVQQEAQGFDIVINSESRLFADLELSAIASAGFHKEHWPEDTVQIRSRADGRVRTVLGHARLEDAPA